MFTFQQLDMLKMITLALVLAFAMIAGSEARFCLWDNIYYPPGSRKGGSEGSEGMYCWPSGYWDDALIGPPNPMGCIFNSNDYGVGSVKEGWDNGNRCDDHILMLAGPGQPSRKFRCTVLGRDTKVWC
jgi:hypothetical protein